MAYACKILADSISPAGHRITSFEVTFPRIVLAEVNTHCMLARCSASSRAIPVKAKIDAIDADPFVPEVFMKNRGGMQPGEALPEGDQLLACGAWLRAMRFAVGEADELNSIGVHKQYANRLLEPFSWHTAVITATDWDNFDHLRVNPLAQGEFQTAARMMLEARKASEPRALNYDEWHLPYVNPADEFTLRSAGFDSVKVSVARCARVSRERQNDIRSSADEVKMFDERLLAAGHMSPLEHAARPMHPDELRRTEMWDIALDDGPVLRTDCREWWAAGEPYVGRPVIMNRVERVVSFVRGPLHYAAKFNGWVSRRQFVHGEHDILGHRAQQAATK